MTYRPGDMVYETITSGYLPGRVMFKLPFIGRYIVRLDPQVVTDPVPARRYRILSERELSYWSREWWYWAFPRQPSGERSRERWYRAAAL